MISAARLDDIFRDCLYREEEVHAFSDKGMEGGIVPADAVPASGIMHRVFFNPERLAAYKNEIVAMLDELPDPFFLTKGGGWSFLQACVDRNDQHWGEHRDMDRLFTLGLAIKRVTYTAPKELSHALPGGMPYFTIHETDVADPVPAS